MSGRLGSRFQLFLHDATGTRLANLSTASRFSYTRVLNGDCAVSVVWPSEFDKALIVLNRRVNIWRQPVGGANTLAIGGIIRGWVYAANDKGNIKRTIGGTGLNGLLGARRVAYVSGSSQADKTGYAGDLMKAVARENLGTSAASTRQLPASLFSVQADLSDGASLSKAFSYRDVGDVMRELSDASRQAGSEVYFDMEETSESAFEFRTYAGQRGFNRTSGQPGGITFGMEFGNLTSPSLRYVAEDEVNYGYGLGRGQGPFRDIQFSSDPVRMSQSVLALREGAVNASGEQSSAATLQAAQRLVVEGRPYSLFEAKLLSVPGSVYGKDWGFGDRVGVSFDGLQFNAIVRAVTVSVDENGKEDVSGVAEAVLA